MTHASLFSGKGGFDLAAEWMGWENVFHCEINPFCQTILKYYWPSATTYTDITTTDFTIWRGRIDVLTGGFPCQPFSQAGQRKGTEDDRYLWPEMLRAIREIAPSYILGENVDGIFTWDDGLVFETVCTDLENEGYEVQTYRIPACATGAPHRRDRWWFVGHAKHHGQSSAQNGKSSKKGNDGNKTGQDKICKSERSITSRIATPDCPLIHDRRHPRKPEKGQAPQPGNGAEHGDATDANAQGLQVRKSKRENNVKKCPPIIGDAWSEHWLEAATRLCVVDDGLSGRLDPETLRTKERHAAGKWRRESLKAAGNAIVPQIAFEIFKAIDHASNQF